jgi:hypothetical protein
MLQRFTSRLPAIAMAGLLILGLSERAHADLSVTIVQAAPVAAPPNMAGLVGNGQFSSTVTSGIVTSSFTATGQDFPFVGANPAFMDLSEFTTAVPGPATATLIFSENNITSPTGPGTLSQLITGAFVTGVGTLEYTTYADNGNHLFTTVPVVSPPNLVATPTVGLGDSSSVGFTATSPYSLTEVIVMHFASAGLVQLSADSSARFTAVPEPSSMAMAGLGALGLVAYGLRRRKASGA